MVITEDIWEYVEITIKLKNKYILNNQDKVKSMFLKFPLKAFLYFTDTYMDADNFENPYLNSIMLYLDINYYKKIDVDYISLVFSSDEPFFTQPISRNFVVLDKYRE
jgi:hypothetical protein